jgi:hypothetical protein
MPSAGRKARNARSPPAAILGPARRKGRSAKRILPNGRVTFCNQATKVWSPFRIENISMRDNVAENA